MLGQSTSGEGLYNPDAKAKLERGNVATDWTPAPEDQKAYVDNIQIGGTNLLRRSDALDNTV